MYQEEADVVVVRDAALHVDLRCDVSMDLKLLSLFLLLF